MRVTWIHILVDGLRIWMVDLFSNCCRSKKAIKRALTNWKQYQTFENSLVTQKRVCRDAKRSGN